MRIRGTSSALLAIALTAAGVTTGREPAVGDVPRTTWLVPQYVLRAFGDDRAARAQFSGNRTFAIVRPGRAVPLATERGAVATVSYRSFAAFAADAASGAAPTDGAVLYDNEKWADTPPEEKADPAEFERKAAALAHARGLRFIAAPAMDLTAALDRGPGTIAQKYLRLGIARDAARYADVLDIQAQSLEFDPAAYAAFVAAAARQARAANPRVVITAGLTTGRNRPDGSPPTADDLLRAARAARGTVDGYWLNVPNHGADCPQCGAFLPDIALEFVRRFATDAR